MSALLHDKTVEITAAGTYEVNPDNELIMINTVDAVVLTLPLPTVKFKKFTIECVGVPDLTINDNADVLVLASTEQSTVITVEYIDTAWYTREFTLTIPIA
jgi:hypothetical protein